MEIGDTIELEEAGTEESSARSAKSTGPRRKNERNSGKGRTGARTGNGNGAAGRGADNYQHSAPGVEAGRVIFAGFCQLIQHSALVRGVSQLQP